MDPAQHSNEESEELKFDSSKKSNSNSSSKSSNEDPDIGNTSNLSPNDSIKNKATEKSPQKTTCNNLDSLEVKKPYDNETSPRIRQKLKTIKKETRERALPSEVLPLVIINDTYYDDILDFLKNEGASQKKKTFSFGNEELYKQEYNDIPLEKFIISKDMIDDYSVIQQPDKDVEAFLAEATIDIKVYEDVEICRIKKQLRKHSYFQENCEKKLDEWIHILFIIFQNFIKVKLGKFPFHYQKQGSKYPSLYISSKENIDYTDFIGAFNMTSFHKLYHWNILYYYETDKKETNKLHDEYEFIEDEINCDFVIINRQEHFQIFIESIKLRNEDKYQKENKIFFTLIITGFQSQMILEYLKQNDYLKFFNRILIFTKNKDKLEQELSDYPISGFFSDKNEVLTFFLKNKPQSLPMELNEIITLDKYKNRYYLFHEKLAKHYGKSNKENFEKAMEDFKNFLSTYSKDLKINAISDNDMSIRMTREISGQRDSINTTLQKEKNRIFTLKKDSLLEALKVFGNFEDDELMRYKKIIQSYTNEENSFYQDFHYWLRELDDISYDKISYCIADIVFSLNEYARIENKGLQGERRLYRGLLMPFGDLLLYKENEGNIFTFPSFTSTSSNKELAEDFSEINKNTYEDIQNRKQNTQFSVLMDIVYDCDVSKEQVPSCVNISELSSDDDNLFLPFTFFKILEVDINSKKYTATVKLKAINKKQILEKYLNENNKIVYDDIQEIIEIKKVKNILIHDIDPNIKELSELNTQNNFLEQIADGNFLITNSKKKFYLILDQIKEENISKSKEDNLVKFELVLFEGSAKAAIDYLIQNKYLGYFNSIIVISAHRSKYRKELEKKIITEIYTNRLDLLKFFREKCTGSLYSMRNYELISFSKYNKKHFLFHEIISKYYQKISQNYIATANDIFKDFIISRNPDLKIDLGEDTNFNNSATKKLKQEKILKSLDVFKDFGKNEKDRYVSIIKAYTSEEYSFYKDFNSWLRDLDPLTYEKTGYFISDFILSLNKYAQLLDKGLKGEHKLYRGLVLKFSELLIYQQNKGNIITFPSFTSTSMDEKVAVKFSDYTERDVEERRKDGSFSCLMFINYNCQGIQKPNAVDIQALSFYNEDERLILPFSFFRIKNVIIDCKHLTGIIELDIINKEFIIEEKLTNKDILVYNQETNLIEIRKQIVIYNIIDTEHETTIFGWKFAEKNKMKIKLFIEGKEIDICSKYKFQRKGENIVEIILKQPIEDASGMFYDCTQLISIDSLKNWDISNIKNTSFMFFGCSSITSIDVLKNWNMSEVTTTCAMFSGCNSLTTIDSLKNWDMSNVNDISSMFNGCSSIISIDALKSWNVVNVNDAKHMFNGCSCLTSIDALKNWKLSSLQNSCSMFTGCSNLKSIDALKKWNTSNNMNTSGMFTDCVLLENIDALQNWDMSNVYSIYSMFQGCCNLKNINAVAKWDMSNVENANNLFCGCVNLEDISALQNWNLKNVRDLVSIFNNCYKIESIDALENWDMRKVETMNSMFRDCQSIKSLDAIKRWDISNLKDASGMFFGCSSLNSVDALKEWNTKSLENSSYMFYNCSGLKNIDALKKWNKFKLQNVYKMFQHIPALNSDYVNKIFPPKKKFSFEKMKLQKLLRSSKIKRIIFVTDNIKWETDIFGKEFVRKNSDKVKLCIDGNIFDLTEKYLFKNKENNIVDLIESEKITNMSGMFENCSLIKSLIFENWDMKDVANTSLMFYGCSSLLSIDTLKNWDMSDVRRTSDMFSGCSSLESLEPIRNWNMNKVENVSKMFSDCTKLKTIDPIKNWKLSHVTEMRGMFQGCSSLKSIDAVTNWDISKVNNLSNLFAGCVNLVSIDALRNWEIKIVETTSGMLSGCANINSIEALKNWKFLKVADTHNMFSGCCKINNIDIVKNWNMSDVRNMNSMFFECKNITSLDSLKNWDVSNVVNISNMFNGCCSLKSIDALQYWNIKKLKDCSGLFYGCSNINSVNALSKWNMNNVENASYMFCGCDNLNSIDCLKNWNMRNTKDMQYLFSDCASLNSIEALGSWNVSSVKNTCDMFKGCKNIDNIDCLKNWNMSNNKYAQYMFYLCSKIKSVDALKNWNMCNVKYTEYMFCGCSELESIESLNNWKLSRVEKCKDMFKDCPKITKEAIDEFFGNVRQNYKDK